MKYTQVALLALALGANARSQRRQWGSASGNPWADTKAVSSGDSSSGSANPWASWGSIKQASADSDDKDSDDSDDKDESSSDKDESSSDEDESSSSSSDSSSDDSSSSSDDSSSSSGLTSSNSTSTGSGSSAPLTTGTATLASGGSSGGSIPAAKATSVLKAAQTIAAGESFDGGMASFDRGVSCTGQSEGGDSDAVFILEVSNDIPSISQSIAS